MTGMSHPSTATHLTDSQMNKTVVTDATKTTTTVPSAPATLPVTNQQGFLLFERANFKDSIMIHVIDDSKKEKRDFTFSRSLLVKYMKYFDRCLKKISDNDEIDISIHCDAVIFEWLLNYIFAMEEYEKKQSEAEKIDKKWSLKV